MRRRFLSSGLHLAGLLAVAVFTLFPFYWMVSSSLKDQIDLLASPPVWTFAPTLANYAEIFQDEKVVNAVVNSLIVASCASARTSRSAAIATGAPWKLPPETISPAPAKTIGLSVAALASVVNVAATKRSASRAAPWTCAAHRSE